MERCLCANENDLPRRYPKNSQALSSYLRKGPKCSTYRFSTVSSLENSDGIQAFSLHDLLLLVYCLKGESTPVESPVVITCLCVSGRPSLRGNPVELLGWYFHEKVIEVEAQACGGMSGDQ